MVSLEVEVPRSDHILTSLKYHARGITKICYSYSSRYDLVSGKAPQYMALTVLTSLHCTGMEKWHLAGRELKKPIQLMTW